MKVSQQHHSDGDCYIRKGLYSFVCVCVWARACIILYSSINSAHCEPALVRDGLRRWLKLEETLPPSGLIHTGKI